MNGIDSSELNKQTIHIPPSVTKIFFRVGELVYNALIEEAILTPKPGLVDCQNNGAHTDMDIFSFYDSACVISTYMPEFVRLGYIHQNTPPQTLLKKIRPLGIECEQAMLKVTDGINTHKGAIFAFGILCAAIGRLLPTANLNDVKIGEEVALICQNIVENELNTVSTQHTAGYKVYQKYGISGARGEAQSGFATVRLISLPLYTQLRNCGKTKENALLQALVMLMANNNDTNVLARGGIDGLNCVQSVASTYLAQGNINEADRIEALNTMDKEFTRLNLSPGGSADLLAITHFLYDIQTKFN